MPDSPPSGSPLRSSHSSREIEDWALVLTSAGLAARVTRDDEGFALFVPAAERGRAEAELLAYDAENPRPPPRTEAAAAEATWTLSAARNTALTAMLGMIGFYALTGPGGGDVFGPAGAADAARIRAGEAWRLVTALTLHADGAHLVANLLFGGLFLGAVARSLGGGVAVAFVLLAGTGGNLLNAVLRSQAHVSIGASTAVFGAIGLLTGRAATRALARGERRVRIALPLAAGLGLLAMIGSGGGRTDVFAHLFGLLVGIGLGGASARLLPAPPGRPAQAIAAVLAMSAVIGAWWRALA